jgi:16S rRNA U1498 N3-methylase RsmE
MLASMGSFALKGMTLASAILHRQRWEATILETTELGTAVIAI